MLAQAKKSKVAVQALNGIMALPVDRDVNQGKVVPDRCTARLETDAISFDYDQRPGVSFPALRFNPVKKWQSWVRSAPVSQRFSKYLQGSTHQMKEESD